MAVRVTTTKRSIGNAKLSIEPPKVSLEPPKVGLEPPKVHALPAGSAITVFTPDPFLLFGSHLQLVAPKPVLQSVEQKPEQQRHQGQEIPDGGEGTQRGLEPLYQVGLSVRGRLFDERQGRDIPGPGVYVADGRLAREPLMARARLTRRGPGPRATTER
jgi:hypothetical protein